ncbi:MAG: DUF3592 domain-containing protein [Actinomycetota bacterium]
MFRHTSTPTVPTASFTAQLARTRATGRTQSSGIVGFIGVATAVFLGVMTLVVGVVFSAVGSSAMAEVEPHADGVSTVGQVVGAAEKTVVIDGVARRHYAPIYVYEDLEGTAHRVTDYMTAESRPLAVGTTVELSYLPGDPDSVRRTDANREWLQWFVVGGRATAGLGVLIVVGALGWSALRLIQRWRNSGSRFSRNAAMPSGWSSVAKRA